MGLFSRRRDDASTDSDESILASDAGADVDDLNESAASGPWDLSELPEDQEDVPRIDLGALQVPAVDGMQLRLEQGPDGTITAVVLALGGSALELRAFAAPRTAGIWDELRSDIANELAGNGARYEESYGGTAPSWSPTCPCAAPTVRRQPVRSVSWGSTDPAGSCGESSRGTPPPPSSRPRRCGRYCAASSSSVTARPARPARSCPCTRQEP